MTDWETLAKLLKAHRARAGLTQQQFADRCGVSLSVINRLESGHAPHAHPSQRTVARIAQQLPRVVGEQVVNELGYRDDFFVYADEKDRAREVLGDLVDQLDDDELDHVRRHIEWVLSHRDT